MLLKSILDVQQTHLSLWFVKHKLKPRCDQTRTNNCCNFGRAILLKGNLNVQQTVDNGQLDKSWGLSAHLGMIKLIIIVAKNLWRFVEKSSCLAPTLGAIEFANVGD